MMPENPSELRNGGGVAPVAEDRALTALVALLAADRDERAEGVPPRRSEFVLAEIGFSHKEIARLTGKETEAVRSTLRRAKGAATKQAAAKRPATKRLPAKRLPPKNAAARSAS